MKPPIKLSHVQFKTTTGSVFRVSRGAEVYGVSVRAVVVVGKQSTPLSVRAGGTDAQVKMRPGSAVRARLASDAEGRELLASARKEIGTVLELDGLAPLASLRLKRGLSQGQLADVCGIPQPQLSRLENGAHSTVTLATLRRLSEALGASLEEVASAVEGSRAARDVHA